MEGNVSSRDTFDAEEILYSLGPRLLKERICLAPLEWGSAGEGGDEGLGALGAGGSQRCEDMPGARAVGCLVAAGDFASDYRRPQLTLGQIVGGIDFIVIEEGEKVIALFE